MKFTLDRGAICLMMALAAPSCDRAPGPESKAETRAIPQHPDGSEIGTFGVDLQAFDAAVDPGDDFYRYVNGGWLATFKIPDGRSSYSAATHLADQSRARMDALYRSLASARLRAGSIGQKIRDLHESYLDRAAINARGLTPAAADLAAIDAVASLEDFYALRFDPASGALGPLAFVIDVDAKRPDRYAAYLTQGELGLGDRDHYLDDLYKDDRIRYRAYIAALLSGVGVADPHRAADAIISFETDLARAQWEPAKQRNHALAYNPKSPADLAALAPAAPWTAILRTSSLGDLAEIVLREDDAIRASVDIIAATPIETLRDYLKFQLLNTDADVLPAEFEAARRDLGCCIPAAGADSLSWNERAAAAVSDALGDAAGRLYAARHLPAEATAEARALTENLRAAANERLVAQGWMDDETRIAAQAKLAKLAFKVGAPERARDYSRLEISAGDAYGNRRRVRRFNWEARRAQLAEPVDRTIWDTPAQAIEAHYQPLFNELYVPAGFLAAPFFDLKADPAVNFGAAGAVIAHEMLHAVDAFGRRIDADGVLDDWWSAGTEDAYAELTARFTDAPSAEAFADAGGLAIAYDAWRRSLAGKPAPVIDGLTGDQRFFLGYAQAMRRAVRDDQTRADAPAADRVNRAVSSLDAWYAAFGVTPDDDLWIDPEDRIQIW